MGFPFLKISSWGSCLFAISQKRFINNPDENINEPESSFEYVWNVPVALMLKNGPDIGLQIFEKL